MSADRSDLFQGQGFVEHLTELRDRLVKSVWAVAVCSIACWFYKEPIFEILIVPIIGKLKSGNLMYTGPVDMFVIYIKITLSAGVAFSTPVWLYQAWRFVAPGLYAQEKRYGIAFILSGTILFLTGLLFAYFLILPAGLGFLLEMQPSSQTSKVIPMIDIMKYLSFLTSTALVFGVAFELPLVLTLLGIIGIIDQAFLREKRRIAIFILAVVSAVVTPPDALSMLMLLLPLCLLYEISIILVGILGRKRVEL